MMAKYGGVDKCPACQKSVYPMEKVNTCFHLHICIYAYLYCVLVFVFEFVYVDKCHACQKSVYPMEKVNMLVFIFVLCT